MSPRPANSDIAQAVREMALFEIDEVSFKPHAYEKAAYAVGAVDRPLADIYDEGGKGPGPALVRTELRRWRPSIGRRTAPPAAALRAFCG